MPEALAGTGENKRRMGARGRRVLKQQRERKRKGGRGLPRPYSPAFDRTDLELCPDQAPEELKGISPRREH